MFQYDFVLFNKFLFFFVDLLLFLFWHLFGVGLWRLKRYTINCAASCAFDHIACPIGVANFGLTIPTNEEPIERIAFVHIVTTTANIELSISWDALFECAEITGHIPK